MCIKKSKNLLLSATAALALFAAPHAYSQSAVISDDFEVTYDGWVERGDFTRLSAAREAAYNSSRGMKVTGRKAASDGAVSAKGFYLDGRETYAYSVFVKHDGKAPETFNLALRWLFPDGKTYDSTVIASAEVKPGQWTELSAKYAAPKTAVNLTLSIYTANGTADFCFDRFTVTGNGGLRKSARAAAVGDKSLKNVYANHFRVGNILNGTTINNNTIKALILKDYNSISMENEMKPDATIRQNGSTNDNILAQLNTGAAAILNFCQQNNIAVRGHVLVWHGQSPRWFFTSNLQNPTDPGNTNSVSWATKAVMEKRLETYINNMFKLIKEQYPTVNLYAYDVVNEAVGSCNNVLGARCGGYDFKGAGGVDQTAEGNSPWAKIYGDNSFIESAFKYAKSARDTYFPNCKLFYNDYNEWDQPKRDHIISQILTPLKNKGYLDGMGMQGHIDAYTNGWASVAKCTTAMNMYANLPIEVQITELDVGVKTENQNATQQASRYKGVFEHAVKINNRNKGQSGKGKFTAIVIWGPNDANSWRGADDKATLHDGSGNPKDAYNSVVNLIPQSEWGDGDNPPCCGSTPPVQCPTPPAATPGNLVKDGLFPGTALGDNWALANVDGGTEASASVSCNKATVSITATGTETYQPQITQQNIKLEQGKAYRLTFKASAAGNRTITAQLERLGGDDIEWGYKYGEKSFSLTTAEKACSLEFNMADPTDERVQLAFNFGGSTQGVTISDVVLLSTGTTSVQAGQIARGNMQLVTIRGRTLNVNSSNDSKVRVRLVNMMGKTVANFNASGNAKLSLKKIPAGAYMVEARRIKDGYKMTSSIVLK